MYDIENEVQKQRQAFWKDEKNNGVDDTIIKGLLKILNEFNPLAKIFQMETDKIQESSE